MMTSNTNGSKEHTSRSERVRRTWQNPERRIKQSAALKRCWEREDYRNRVTEHLRRISPLGRQWLAEHRKAGLVKTGEQTRRRQSISQKKRFQRPEEQKKLDRARELSYQAVSLEKRAQMMQEAFLKKYGSFLELAKMGLKAPRRKPNKLEIETAKLLGEDWQYVGQGELVIGGLIPDFVHKKRKVVLEVMGCYFHGCPTHFPNVRMGRTASTGYKESVYKKNGYNVIFLWEHDIRRRKLAFKDAGVRDPSVYAE